MAKYNQFAGRTAQNWWARYNERIETAKKQIIALNQKGIAITLNPPQKIGGPGVPGNCTNHITATLAGKIVTRKQIRKLCLQAGVKLNAHSQPI